MTHFFTVLPFFLKYFMTQNTKNFTDNKCKIISAENNRQFYGGKNSFERGDIFEEKAESLANRVDSQFKKGPPKMKPGLTKRQQDVHLKKLDAWDERQDRLDRKVSIWRDQAEAVKATITYQEELQLEKYLQVLKYFLSFLYQP